MIQPSEKKGLVTLAEYQKLTPRVQGWVAYMEAEWPGSELKGNDSNPYPPGRNHDEWDEGQFRATLAAQDSEE